MATKTISLRVEAYEKLRRARTRPSKSFSDVVMRARWEDQTVTGGELLALVRERGPLYGLDALDAIDELKSETPIHRLALDLRPEEGPA
jgi:predicted CopG family antitoxin